MKLEKVINEEDINYSRPRKKRGEIRKMLEEFCESGDHISKVIMESNEYVNAYSLSSALKNTINRYNFNIKVIVRKNEVYIINPAIRRRS